MLYKKLLITGTLSTLLLASTLFAQENCVGGVCFVKLDNLKPTKGFNHVPKQKLVVLDTPRYIDNNSELDNHISLEKVEIEKIDKSFDVVVDNEVVAVFPSYVMTENEKMVYLQEQKAIALNDKFNEEENRELRKIGQIIEKIEDTILNKAKVLPTSDYYCDDNTHPVYHTESDSFECV